MVLEVHMVMCKLTNNYDDDYATFDSWSFGVLMWEVVTVGGTPYSDVHVDDLFTQLHSGMRLKRPNHCTQPVYDIMTSCWEAIPQHRPLFMEIVNALNTLNTSKMVC